MHCAPQSRRLPGLRLTLLLVVLSLGSAGALAAPAAADVGFRGSSYAPASAPTGQKPQSKLWFHDGAWWGSLFNGTTERYEIHRLDRQTNRWTSTGTVIDDRNTSSADLVSAGSLLYAASATPSSTAAIRVSRYRYDPVARTYALDTGFPVTVATGGTEAVTLDRDSAGGVWVSYTQGQRVLVAHTVAGDDRRWTAPFAIPVDGASNLTADDISALVAYRGRIGVMWSNQNESAMHFASHRDGDPDGAWVRSTAVQQPEYADDHINLKSLQSDPSGQVFAATKTSLNASDAPLLLLLVLDGSGGWQRHTFGRVSEGHTRPLVLIDREHRELYMLASSPCCSGGTIYYKRTPLDRIAFAPGLGTPFIQSATDRNLNNVASTKQELNGTTDLVAIAGDDRTKTYWHNVIDLGAGGGGGGAVDTTPPETTIDAGPSGSTTQTTASFSFSASEPATFECSLDGAPYSSCTTPRSLTGLLPGTHAFRVRATDSAGNVDPTPALREWTVATVGGALFADGFESGGFSSWTTVRTGGAGSATVQTGVVRTGSFAARLASTATSGSLAYARRRLSPSVSALTAGGEFRVEAEGAAGGNVPLLRLYDGAGTRLVSVYRQNLSSDRVYVGHSGAHHATTGRLPLRTWARLQVTVSTAGTGQSTLVVRLGGVEVYRTATASLGTAGVADVQIGNDTAGQAFTAFADDVSVTSP